MSRSSIRTFFADGISRPSSSIICVTTSFSLSCSIISSSISSGWISPAMRLYISLNFSVILISLQARFKVTWISLSRSTIFAEDFLPALIAWIISSPGLTLRSSPMRFWKLERRRFARNNWVFPSLIIFVIFVSSHFFFFLMVS